MHELGMTQRLMALILAKAQEAGATKVVKVNMVIGESSGLIAESISFYFGFLKKGTIAEDAELSFQTVPTRLRCRNCHVEYNPPRDHWNCPECGELSIERLQGGDSYLESLEVQ